MIHSLLVLLTIISTTQWHISFISAQSDSDQPTVFQKSSTGELLNLDETLIRIFNESFFSSSILTDAELRGDGCPDCEFSTILRNFVDGRGVFKRKGRCYAAARGQFQTLFDLRSQDGATRKVCNVDGVCCDAYASVTNAYFTYYSNLSQQWEKAIEECVATCADPEDCLVVQGHSLGGAFMEFAGFVLSRYKPIVLMTGSPTAFPNGCSLLDTSKFFHVENSFHFVQSNLLAIDDTMYLRTGSPVGHRIIISKETHAVSYWGFNQPLPTSATLTELLPSRGEDVIVTTSVCHDLFGFVYSYVPHLEAIINNGVFPVPFGWDNGTPCSRNLDCKSGNCDGVCV